MVNSDKRTLFSLKIKIWLDIKKITTAEFCRTIGCATSTYICWQAGKTVPTRLTVKKIIDTTKNFIEPSDFYTLTTKSEFYNNFFNINNKTIVNL